MINASHTNEGASDSHHRWVKCPQCQGRSLYAQSNAYRPFCSARCKGIDLGAWADETFKVTQKLQDNEGTLPV